MHKQRIVSNAQAMLTELDMRARAAALIKHGFWKGRPQSSPTGIENSLRLLAKEFWELISIRDVLF